MKIDGLSPVATTLEQSKQVSQKVNDQKFEDALKKAANDGDDKRLRETCQEFESVFLNMMLQTMRKTIPDGGLIEKTQATETFESMLDDEYAKSLSKSGGIGLADVLYKQMKKDV